MPQFKRVKNKKTGTEYTVSADIKIGDDVEELSKPATSPEGKPLPEKHKTSIGAVDGTEPPSIPAAKASTPKE